MILLENKRIGFDYEILDTFEGGIVLQGWEVKSLRAKQGNIKGAWVKIRDGEAWIENLKIPAWKYSALEQPKGQSRKILLKKKEIAKLEQKQSEKGMAVALTRIYTKGNKIKCEIIVGKGRKKYEKRQVLKDRSTEKEARKAMKSFNAR